MSTNIQGQGPVDDQFEDLTPEQELEDNLAGVLEMIKNLGDDDKETKKGEKKDEAASSGVFANLDVFGLLGDIVGRPEDAAETVKAFLKNPGSPGGPKLFPPIRDLREVPTGSSGSANAWLSGSVFTDLTMILFEIMPILFKIKLQEAALEAEQIVLLQDVTIKGAEMAKKKKELEAKELKAEAYKQFVQAGVQLAMAGMQAGMSAGGAAKGALKSAGSKLKTAGGMGVRGTKMAGSWGMKKMQNKWANMKKDNPNGFASKRSEQWTDMKASPIGQKFSAAGNRVTGMRDSYREAKQNFSDRKSLLAGNLKGERDYKRELNRDGNETGNTLSTKQAAESRRKDYADKKVNTASERADKKRSKAADKKQSAHIREQSRNQMLQSLNSSLTGVAGGLFDLEKAKIREEIGVAEFLIGVLQGLQTTHQKMIDSSHEARREAAEAISNIMQQFTSINEAQKTFRQTR